MVARRAAPDGQQAGNEFQRGADGRVGRIEENVVVARRRQGHARQQRAGPDRHVEGIGDGAALVDGGRRIDAAGIEPGCVDAVLRPEGPRPRGNGGQQEQRGSNSRHHGFSIKRKLWISCTSRSL